MFTVRWSNLPDPCLLQVLKHFSLIELFCAIRLVCQRWSQVASSELNQRHTLVIACHWMLDQYKVQSLTPSILLKHLRYEDGQLPLVKYRPPIDDRDIVKYGENNRLREPIVSVILKNLPNITNLTLVLIFVDKSDNVDDCELTQLIRILTHYRNNLITLNLSMLDIQYKEYQQELNAETLFNTINCLSSLKHLSLNLELNYSKGEQIPKPKLTILSQLKTFNFSGRPHRDFRIAMLSHFESEKDQFSECCEIGYNIRYWRFAEQGDLEFNKVARFDPKFAAKFLNLSVSGELDLKCYKNLRLICSKFISLKMLELSIDKSFLLSMVSRCVSQLPQLIHLKLTIKSYSIPHEDTPVHNIAQVFTVRLLTLQIGTRSHRDTARLYLAHIFPNIQVLQLKHSSKFCEECVYDYHNIRHYHLTPEQIDREIDQEEQIRISKCMFKAREPFQQCRQLHTVEFNDGPSGFWNRKLASKDEYFTEPEYILPKVIDEIDQVDVPTITTKPNSRFAKLIGRISRFFRK